MFIYLHNFAPIHLENTKYLNVQIDVQIYRQKKSCEILLHTSKIKHDNDDII